MNLLLYFRFHSTYRNDDLAEDQSKKFNLCFEASNEDSVDFFIIIIIIIFAFVVLVDGVYVCPFIQD